MPDNFARIAANRSGPRSAPAGGASLPPAGTVVMATVEEDHGEGVYSLRWGGNRVAVSSRAALTPGETLILRSETSQEGKPVLVVQGPALPNAKESLSRPAAYGPAYRKPAGGEVAAAAMPARSQGPPEPGTTLKPLLEELPGVSETFLELLDSAAEEIRKAEPNKASSSAKAREEGRTAAKANSTPASGDAAGPAKPAADRPLPATDGTAAEATDRRQPPPAPPGGDTKPASPNSEGKASATIDPRQGQPASPEARPDAGAPQPPRSDAAGRRPDQPANPAGRDVPPVPGAKQPVADSGQAQPKPPEARPDAGAPQPPRSDAAGRRPDQPANPAGRDVPPVPEVIRPAPADLGQVRPTPADSRSDAGSIQPPHPDAADRQPAHPLPAAEARPRPSGDAGRVPISAPEAGPNAAPVSARSEVAEAVLREALEQMAKVAELPLGGGVERLDAGRSKGGAVPEAIADKAAAILLNAAGLTPGPAVLDAAKALLRYNVQIDRQTIQTMVALAAGAEEADRPSLLQAAARLAAHDVPLAAPLAGGLADILDRKAGVSQLLLETLLALDPESAPPETRPLLKTAGQMLDLLVVDLDRSDAPVALERFVSTFGREALGKAMALIETATQTLLENHPQLAKIDQALTAILTLLDEDAATGGRQTAGQTATGGGQAAPPAIADGNAPPTSGQPAPAGGDAVPTGQGTPPAGSRPSASGAPPPAPTGVPGPMTRPDPAFEGEAGGGATGGPGDSARQGLPGGGHADPWSGRDGETLDVIVDAGARPFGGAEAGPFPARREAALPGEAGPPASPGTPRQDTGAPQNRPTPDLPLPPSPDGGADREKYAVLDREASLSPRGQGQGGGEAAAAGEALFESAVLRKLKSIFQLPGVNSPETELLRPSGFLDRVIAGGREAAGAGRDTPDALLRELLSDDPRRAEAAIKDLPARSRETLREAAARLSETEKGILRNDPALNRLSDAAGSLRELGRQLIAVKAENLAGLAREPGVMLAEVPFKLADQSGDGRMQMFYRRSTSQKGGWSARVILDLNTTNMGPVLGDMRFFGQDMVLNLFVDRAETAEFLGRSAEELAVPLLAKGFRLKPKFLVLPPPPSPEIAAERPDLPAAPAAENVSAAPPAPAAGTRRRGRLDTKA